MNKRKQVGISSVLGGSALIVTALLLKEKFEDKRRERITREVRDFFSDFGPIDVVYFNEAESEAPYTEGGLVFSDGRKFTFSYEKGNIIYQEEKR